MQDIISFCYPFKYGAREVFDYVQFKHAKDVDRYLPSISANDGYAFEEFDVTHGIALSGRALTCLALNLGNHYLRGIM